MSRNDITEIVDEFILDRKVQNMSPGTIHFYTRALKLFTTYAAQQNVNDVSGVDAPFIRAYLAWLEVTGHNPGGRNACYRAVKAMLRWRATEHDLANWSDPFRKVKAPRLSKVALPPVELDAVRAMLPKCGPRDKAILLMLLDTGLRADELLSLNLDDVDYRSGAVFVRSGKGSKSRTVFISRNTRQALSAYLGERADLNIALFVNRFGDRLGYWGLHLILESRAADAGVEPPTPHDFRRAFAINALRAGMDVYSLQRLMGHADLQIMRRYLDQVTDDLHRAHTKYSPVDKML